MKFLFTRHWLFKAIALAIVVPVLVALTAFAAVHATGMGERGVTSANTAFLVFIAVPPLWLMALAILSRAAMESGRDEQPKGDLEQLLQKKHLGLVRSQPRGKPQENVAGVSRADLEHAVKARMPAPNSAPAASDPLQRAVRAAAPAPNLAPAQSGPLLDRLLAWQRRHRQSR